MDNRSVFANLTVISCLAVKHYNRGYFFLRSIELFQSYRLLTVELTRIFSFCIKTFDF